MLEQMTQLSESIVKSAHEYCLDLQVLCQSNSANESNASECDLQDLSDLTIDQLNVSLVCSDPTSESCNRPNNARTLILVQITLKY